MARPTSRGALVDRPKPLSSHYVRWAANLPYLAAIPSLSLIFCVSQATAASLPVHLTHFHRSHLRNCPATGGFLSRESRPEAHHKALLTSVPLSEALHPTASPCGSRAGGEPLPRLHGNEVEAVQRPPVSPFCPPPQTYTHCAFPFNSSESSFLTHLTFTQ